MKEVFEEMKTLLEGHERRISKLEAVLIKLSEKGKKGGATKKLSVKEFVLLSNPKNDTQKTLCIAYYLEKYEGACSFNVKDLDNMFRLAREKPPGNINDRVNINITKGFMMEAKEKKDNRKAWVLTSSGERFVDNELTERDKVVR